MKKRYALSILLLLVVILLPGRAALAEDPAVGPAVEPAVEPAPPYQSYFPLIARQPNLNIVHIGPDIARTLGVVQDPFNANILYAFTYGSGIYKSTDYGVTWFPSSKGMTYLVLQSLEADPVNPGVLYAGTYSEVYGSDYYGVYKSTDYGATWSQTGVIANTYNGVYYKNPVVYAIEVNPLNPQQIFLGTRMRLLPDATGLGGGGVFRSDNGGLTWTAKNNGLPSDKLYAYDLELNPAHPGQVFVTLHATYPGGVYESNNWGNSWYYRFGYPDALDGRSLLIDPFDPNILYYGAATFEGLWKWDMSSGSLSHPAHDWIVNVAGVAADPYHQGLLFVGIERPYPPDWNRTSLNLARSEDGGKTWTYIDTGRIAYPVAFSPDQQTMYLATDFEGVFRSTDLGKNWYFSSYKLSGYSVTGVVVDPGNYNHLFAALYGVGPMGSNDGGASWYNAYGGMVNKNVLGLAMEFVDPHVMYAITDQTGVYRTDNSGGTWYEINSGYPAVLPGATSALTQTDSMYENRPIPVRDEDLELAAGENPQTQSDPVLQMSTGLAQGNTIVISPFKSSVVLVGTVGRGIYSLSTSAGYQWVPTSQSTGSAYAILFDRGTDGRVLAGVNSASGSLLLSTNNGLNWTPKNTGLTGRTVFSLAQSVADPKTFLAGTDSGVFKSSDGGLTWNAWGLSGEVIRGVGSLQTGQGLVYLALTSGHLYAGGDLAGYWYEYPDPFNEGIGVQSVLNISPDGAVYVTSRFGGITKIR